MIVVGRRDDYRGHVKDLQAALDVPCSDHVRTTLARLSFPFTDQKSTSRWGPVTSEAWRDIGNKVQADTGR